MKYNSLELRWLQKRSKDTPYPNVVYIPSYGNYGGFFCRPIKNTEWFDGVRHHDLSNGLIAIIECGDGLELANTIAHEWRHNWQLYHHGPHNGVGVDTRLPYDKAMQKYFRNYFELDALVYSHKMAPSMASDYWMGLISK